MRKIYIFLFLSISLTAFGQSKKAFLEAATKAELNDNYFAALSYYDEALKYNGEDEDVLYKSANAARQWEALTTAERKYSKLIDTLNSQTYSDARFYLAQVRQKLGKYDEAKMDYELYLSENKDDDEKLTAIANMELKALEWSVSQAENADQGFKIEILGGDVNSPYSDFGAIKVDEDLYYSSLRYEETEPDEKPSKLISKILKSEDGGSGEIIDDDINMDMKPVAHTAFNLDHSRMYYTLCEYKTEAALRCDIYFRDMNPDGTMSDAMIIGTEINDSSHTSTQPNIATDPITGEETLYFSSDREGGKGNLDIWYAKINSDGTVGTPTNAGSINTTQNDITPFYHNNSDMLYFSSRGYMTLGGYDIFSTQITPTGFASAENVGMPANSSYDDVYFTLNAGEDEAYFSSNRLGSQYIDTQKEACCFDIYRADIDDVNLLLNGLTFDKLTNRELAGAMVTVIDAITGKEIGAVTNDEGNEHIIPLRKNKEYIVIGNKDKYYPDTILLSTKGMTVSDTVIRKLYLDSDYYAVDVYTYDVITEVALNGAIVTLTDITDPSNPNVVQVNPLSNDFHFLLDPNKQYNIVANRSEYIEETVIISTMPGVNNERIIRKDVYLLKPELDTYLPLSLYFDNDEPDKNSRSSLTDKVYSNLHRDYMNRKSVFNAEYSNGASDGDRANAENKMESFFTSKVDSGYIKLQTMIGVLVKELQLGQRIEISIRGYASPRFEPKYNLVLGQRRVASVKNDMLNYQGGILRPFVNSGQLKVIDVSFGEELAPSNINDNIGNEKLSIYSPEASKERRVEIISVTKN